MNNINIVYEKFEEIEVITEKARNFLLKYVEMHRKIMEDKGAMRFLKNAFGFKTNFQKLGEKTEVFKKNLETFIQSILVFSQENEKVLTVLQKDYLISLEKYLKALLSTTKELVKISEMLYNINIDSENVNNYDFDKLKSEYQDSVANYRNFQIITEGKFEDIHKEIIKIIPND